MPIDPFAVLSALVRAEAARTAGSRTVPEREEPVRRERTDPAPAPVRGEHPAR
ncbi:hypothetical protein [Streptomyces sp. NBC_01216]|uniref:hypothetical protein n=1 Tax=unclassified Streptomyces TaxID=2593676 RepID=UPI002E15B3CF|nr:hypothetical protein OG393_04455 [Streptomyces sp. NBC_01216]